MKIIIGCEFSGVVRRAFRARGHNAWSCDLLPAEDGSEFHLQGDVVPHLGDGWDLMICHPPCTYLSSSGMHWTTRGIRPRSLTDDAIAFCKTLMGAPIERIAMENPIGVLSSEYRKPDQIVHPWHFGDDASKATCLWLKGLEPLKIDARRCYPPKKWSVVRYATDMTTCPEGCDEPWCELHEAHYHECDCIGPMVDEATYKTYQGVLFATLEKPAPKMIWGNQTPSGQNKLGPSADRWKLGSATFAGIAQTMAEQWG